MRLTPEREAQIRDHLKREKLIEGPLEGNPHVIELLAELDALRAELHVKNSGIEKPRQILHRHWWVKGDPLYPDSCDGCKELVKQK